MRQKFPEEPNLCLVPTHPIYVLVWEEIDNGRALSIGNQMPTVRAADVQVQRLDKSGTPSHDRSRRPDRPEETPAKGTPQESKAKLVDERHIDCLRSISRESTARPTRKPRPQRQACPLVPASEADASAAEAVTLACSHGKRP